jgi:hypothetical protein
MAADELGEASALIAWTRAEGIVVDWTNARRIATRAADIARSVGNAYVEGQALELIAKTLPAPDARAMLARAAARYRAAGDVYALAELLAGGAFDELVGGETARAVEMVSEAARLERELDDALLRCFIRGNEGLTALFDGRPADARAAFEEELVLSHELALRLHTAEALMGLAALTAREDEPELTARLWGAALAQDPPSWPSRARLEHEFLAAARDAAGLERWEAACRQGQALALHEATELALRGPPSTSGPAVDLPARGAGAGRVGDVARNWSSAM